MQIALTGESFHIANIVFTRYRAIDELRGHFTQLLEPKSHLIQLPGQVILHQNITDFGKLTEETLQGNRKGVLAEIYQTTYVM